MLPLQNMLTVQKLIQDKASYGTMNIFGMIVYTEEHPFIAKVLKDKDYWASLNARTKNWILYAVAPQNDYGHLTKNYILPELGIENSKDLPQLVIIAIGPNRTFLRRGYPIDDKDEATAYNSIKQQIDTVTDAASKILPEYWSSTHVHREVIKALEAELDTEKWKMVSLEFAGLIKALIALV